MMNKKIKLIIIIELLIIIIFGLFAVTYDGNEQQVDVSVKDLRSDYVVFADGGWQIGEEVMDGTKEVLLLRGPDVPMDKGDYTITISYQCENDQRAEIYAGKYEENFIKAGNIRLDNCFQMISYDFRFTEAVDEFEIKIYYDGNGYFAVSDVSIQENNNGLLRGLGVIIAAFILANLILLYYISSEKIKRYMLHMTLITALTSLPLFYIGVDEGAHDLIFHLTRIEAVLKELQLRNFPVRISSAWLGGYGYPASIYYGDILLYIPAIIRMFGFSINTAYKIFVVLINLFTSVISEVCFRNIFKKEKYSFILAMVYSLASYRQLCMYVRAAVGEYCALMFLPLIALAVYRIYTDENNTWKENLINATILAIGMSGTILVHVLSAEMVFFALLLICIVLLKKTILRKTIRTYLLAVLETVLISAFFLVPFLDYYLNVPVKINDVVNDKTASAIQEYGANIGEFFAFFSNPYGGSETAHISPGPVLMIVFIVAVIICINRKATKQIKILTVLSGVMLIISTNAFPWNNLTHDYKLFGLLSQIQFPFRFLGIAIILLTLLLGFIIVQVDLEAQFKMQKQTFINVCLIISVCAAFMFVSHYADRASRVMYYDTAELDSHDIMNEEYLRSHTDYESFDGKVYSEDTLYVDVISRIGCNMDVKCKTGAKQGYMILPILNYKGYTITDNIGNQYEISDSENNLISFILPADFDGTIYLRFDEPWYWTMSLAISVISIVLLFGLGVGEGVKRKKKIM